MFYTQVHLAFDIFSRAWSLAPGNFIDLIGEKNNYPIKVDVNGFEIFSNYK